MSTATVYPEIVCFVNNCFIHNGADPEKIDLTDATYNLCSMMVDGVELPEGVTPFIYMHIWNNMVDSMNKYPDGIVSDDSDGF